MAVWKVKEILPTRDVKSTEIKQKNKKRKVQHKVTEDVHDPNEPEDLVPFIDTDFIHVDDFKEEINEDSDSNSDSDNEFNRNVSESEDENLQPFNQESIPSKQKLIKEEPYFDPLFDVSSWERFNLSESTLKALKYLRFSSPTEIQSRTLPISLKSNRHIVGVAETGSGKTLAFGIPIIESILKIQSSQTPLSFAHSLILAPTRELVIQITEHLKSLSIYTNISIISIVGGLSHHKQKRLLDWKPQIIVATPGRLWEHISQEPEYMNYLKHTRYIVLDEADRMLEQGHFRELENILIELRRKQDPNQIIQLFSATLIQDEKIKARLESKNGKQKRGQSMDELLSRLYLGHEKVIVNVLGRVNLLSHTLKEYRIDCLFNEKDLYLYYMISKYQKKTLVFTNSIDCVRRLVPLFNLFQIPCFPLHSDLQQKQRLKNLERFSSSQNGILIASDIAARGIDTNVDIVIHYQVPKSVDTYIHRSGRTARAGNIGTSILFVCPEELKLYGKICSLLKKDSIDSLKMDENHVSFLRKRIHIAKKINDLEHKQQKKSYDRNWVKKMADDADLVVSDQEIDVVNDGQVKEMKKQLLMMLKQ